MIRKIYRLKHLVRYNNEIRLKDESVAEHQFFVARIVFELKKFYEFDVDKAIKMALIHDESEIDTTDVPHNVKKKYPAIKKAIKDSEAEFFSTYDKEIESLYLEYEENKTTEALVVEYADTLSCIQYSDSEVKLGNFGYMKDVYKNSLKRARDLEVELIKYLK